MLATKQVTVTLSGNVYPLGSETFNNGVWIKALSTNSGTVYIGNNGYDTVTMSDGFPLDPGDLISYDNVGSLSEIYCVGTRNGDKVAILDSEV
jgi:hypothetical protein